MAIARSAHSGAAPISTSSGAAVFVPDSVVVRKATRLEGQITAPPSKSYSHRALMVAGLCEEEVFVENPLNSDDIRATADAWQALGTSVQWEPADNRYRVHGVARPFQSMMSQPDRIYVKESGTTLRFLLPGLAFASQDIRVEGKQSLKHRPNHMIVAPLQELGVRLEGEGDSHKVPITVHGAGFLPAGEVKISGENSSQVVSAFLLWLPLASYRRTGIANIVSKFVSPARRRKSVIRVQGNLVSKPYVDITIDALRRWGQIVIDEEQPGSVYSIPVGQRFSPSSRSFSVNGDYSSAAFVLVAATLCHAEVLVRGLRQDKQGDRAIVEILRNMGARLEQWENGIQVKGPTRLTGMELDCSSIPDLVPILCVLGAFAEGKTILKNIAHLKYKETDRLKGPTEELRKLGVQISHTDDSIVVEKSQLTEGRVSARGDHRMAMSLMVAGLAGNGIYLDGATSIKKSYPDFIQDMQSIGAVIESLK